MCNLQILPVGSERAVTYVGSEYSTPATGVGAVGPHQHIAIHVISKDIGITVRVHVCDLELPFKTNVADETDFIDPKALRAEAGEPDAEVALSALGGVK